MIAMGYAVPRPRWLIYGAIFVWLGLVVPISRGLPSSTETPSL